MRGRGNGVLGAIIFGLSLTSCAQQPQAIWLKPSAASDEFSQDRYACLQQSQQPNSAAYVTQYGGAARSNIITNGGLFDACMNSRGWVLTPLTDVKGFRDALTPVIEELRAGCSGGDLRPLFLKKMACKATDATPEQLSDRSKPSNEEKAALIRWVDLIQSVNERVAAIYRQYDTKNGDAVASAIESGTAETRRLALEFSRGAFTWGEYNKQRIALSKTIWENQKIALSN